MINFQCLIRKIKLEYGNVDDDILSSQSSMANMSVNDDSSEETYSQTDSERTITCSERTITCSQISIPSSIDDDCEYAVDKPDMPDLEQFAR